MKDFDRWFNEAGRDPEHSVTTITRAIDQDGEELPEGVYMGFIKDNPSISPHKLRYLARCRSCDRAYEIDYDPKDFTEDGNYCNGSQYCTP